ncbi:GAF domain-containing protein [Paeniglutamicibacter sp. ABSL32-1]|uniref:GAF domain-containing protein n=1 Tax=Paeniglutamicibacter quisquiliarum TaxID=2849498 RepID=UPI001C2D5E39|nr:GAF domain-containing protein [Paeniglutamicibacter quisquiliarum]MBV1777510.1 GAF domain-containing protein [Paeniglutamicibacter quisquiliarum]
MSLISPASKALQRSALAAHETLGTGAHGHGAWQLRDVVRASWLRSLEYRGAAASIAHTVLGDEALRELRTASPLRLVLPVFDRLLLEPTRDARLILAIGDPHGRLLWVKGDSQVLRDAESMAFVPGADWSERAVGTSAPGTALVTGGGVQVSGAEHFDPIAHRWSCTAVPIHAPDTGEVIGVVDITGGPDAVAAHSLALLQAAVAAAESELRWHRQQVEPVRRSLAVPAAPAPHAAPVEVSMLRLTSGTGAELRRGAGCLELSSRHAELLGLLSWHPRGLSGEELVELLHLNPDAADMGTLRAEMVRLRKVLAEFDPSLVPLSRPYRLASPPASDAREVLRAIENGDLDAALAHYAGPVLPRSQAPGIEAIRDEVFAALRQGLLQDGTAAQLLRFLELPEVHDDEEVLSTTLQVLPARSPRRAMVVAALERLERLESAG